MHPPRRLAGSHGVDRTRGPVKVRDGGLKKCPHGTTIAQRDPLTKTFRPIYRDLCPNKKHFQGIGFCTRRLAGSHGVDRTRGPVKVRDGGLKKCPHGTAIVQRDPLTKTFRPIYRDLCPHKKHFQGTGFCSTPVA